MTKFANTPSGYFPLYASEPTREMIFTIEGEPMSKARPRTTRSGHTYTPKATVEAEQRVIIAFNQAQNKLFFEHNLAAEFKFYRGTRHKKDVDNMEKLVLDALNGIAYPDDSQVKVLGGVEIRTTKERARTVVHFYEVGELEE